MKYYPSKLGRRRPAHRFHGLYVPVLCRCSRTVGHPRHGYAQQEVAPDTAYVTIGMETTGEDAQQARTQNNEVMSQVTAAMKSMGIAPENLKTMGFYMSPNYDSKSRKIVSYTVTNNLQIKVSDLDMIPRIIAKAANLNANSIQGIRFTNEKTEQIKDNLVKQAIINGRRQAEAAAQAAGMSLGKVKEISISGRSRPMKTDTPARRCACPQKPPTTPPSKQARTP